MKIYLLLLSVILSPFAVKAQKTITLTKDTITYDATNIERAPSFPGGQAKFNQFIAENLKYPVNAPENNIEGEVELSFIVNTDGSLSHIKVTKSLAADLDKEALRVMKLSPKWIPGLKDQKAINCSVRVPVGFKRK